jgi:hypothetical protein
MSEWLDEWPQWGVRMGDARIAPRVRGRIAVCWSLASHAGQEAQWLAGQPVAGAWQQQEGVAEVSVSGLRLAMDAPPAVGDRLLLTLRLRRGGRPLRAVAIVRRVDAGGVACELAGAGPGTATSLFAFTWRRL